MVEIRRYAVVLKRQEDFRPMEIAQVLASARRAPVQDLAAAAKDSWGIVAEGMEEGEARGLASLLEAAGLGALVVPGTLLEDLPPFTLVSKVEVRPGGLWIRSDSGMEETVPWNRIILVAAAAYRQTTYKTGAAAPVAGIIQKAVGLGIMMATGLPIPIGPKRQAEPKKFESSELVFFLDIVAKEDPRRWRIDAQNFDYSTLRARMGYAAMGNFKLLVEEVSAHAVSAVRNRGTRVLMEGSPVREMGYGSLADLERESRWLLTLTALNPRG